MKKLKLYRRLLIRREGFLSPERAASRLSAYVYGNILALAAVVVATPDSITHGTAAVLVAGTGATTFLAHVFAEFVAYINIPDASGGTHPDRHIRAVEEFRDAVPIVSSSAIPSLVLALGWLDVLSPRWAFGVAGALVVIRMATVQLVTERLRGNPLSFKVFVGGLATAGVAAIIVTAKFFLTH